MLINSRKCIHNLFFISNSKNIDIFCDLYNKINLYRTNNIPIEFHVIERYHLEETGLMKNIDFKYIVGIDVEIEYKCFLYGTPGYENIGKQLLLS